MVVKDEPGLNQKFLSSPIADEGNKNRIRSIRLLTLFVCIVSALVAAGMLVLLSNHPTWQTGVLALLDVVTAGVCGYALRSLYPRKLYSLGVVATGVSFGVSILVTAALIAGLGYPLAIVYLIFTLIISSATWNDRFANLAITVGIVIACLSSLATDFSPFSQISIEPANILTYIILGLLFLTFITMQVLQIVTSTLRIRLVTSFIAIVIIPVSVLSILQTRFMFDQLTREAYATQKQASKQAAFAVDQLLFERQVTVQESARIGAFTRYLELPVEKRKGSLEEQAMQFTLKVLDANELKSSTYLSSFALLDLQGINLYDTRTADVGRRESSEPYYILAVTTGKIYTSPVEVQDNTHGFFYISAPVKNDKDQAIGVLRARYDGQMLQDLLGKYNGLLGPRSYAVLLDENNIRLADQYTPQNIYKSIAPLSPERILYLKATYQLPDLPADMLSTNLPGFDQLVNNYERQPVFTTELTPASGEKPIADITAVAPLTYMPWKVVYIRENFSDEVLRQQQRRLTTLVTTLIAGLVGLIAIGVAQLLSGPIMRLTATAQIIARGNLEAQAPAKTADEFGMLGAAFNSMTAQLRMLISQLEDRVKARTQEIEDQNTALAHRARQFLTVSEVARQIVSSQELEPLLSSITHLISDRFGFYHVGIFLLDDKKEYAVLRAANSEGGQRMLARRHALSVGRVGIVGYATGTGQARIATDVGEDATYFNNPDLPETRSEMALPLKVGDQIIGALDIQSIRPDDFQPEDIELFSTLADQVAIAIYNNQLYTDTLRALDEAQNLHRQYLRSEWAQDTAQRKVLGYLYNQSGIMPQKIENPLWKKVFASGDPVYAALPSNNGSPDRAVMAVPITVRGETIGVIQVQDQGEGRLWSEDEITVVNSIASQVAVALENARLFENTVRRAEREKKVLQITAKIRSTNDPEEMMRIAVSELQQALNATRTQIYIRQEDSE